MMDFVSSRLSQQLLDQVVPHSEVIYVVNQHHDPHDPTWSTQHEEIEAEGPRYGVLERAVQSRVTRVVSARPDSQFAVLVATQQVFPSNSQQACHHQRQGIVP